LFFFDSIDLFDINELSEVKAELVTTEVNAIKCKHQLKTTIYPLEEIVEKFQSVFFTSTICYMLAYALHLGYNKIDLYGIDHVGANSYTFEKPGVDYWVGRIQQSGGTVTTPLGSAVCRTIDGKLYGYNYHYPKDFIRIR